ncbi:hypothetical protein C2E21_7824 [Chlorella sorokiniana]|uniref:Peptidase M11 gametolysin domain-containing protein n=1 Tax=Chlorella sorokiniana TaxID=3076 RepID=A0A2P6TGM8_CHLSO|nr:hypothetical protein C2E21_7824 [Chlorella sorokiniana]|eukprot:PRW33287.1 hypothetical protein C2E21_7824 [Chlorella sorokiniana]
MQNSLVAERVRLPCAGNTNGYPWSFSKCDFDDFSGWADAADAVLQQRGVDLNKYKYTVYLIPPSTCGWVGLGYVGCDGSFACRSWINGDFWGAPQAIAHELGHNLFLGHASAYLPDGQLDEYGDDSSSMGHCCDPRCFSTPQMWQMGWISAQQLDATTFKPGVSKQVWLGSHSAAANAGVRILTPWANGSDPIFLGFRTADGGDKALPATAVKRVHIYQSPVSGTYDAVNSIWRGSLATAGAAWAHSATGLVVRFVSVSNGGANVAVCRKAAPAKETLASCKAGLDNDCNGKTGWADPVCKTLLTAAGLAPPPPPRPPPLPAPEDADGLRLALNRAQRHNLKLSSKLSKARDEAAAKAAEARRWAAAVEQQEGQLAELRVQLEAERRQRFEAQQVLAAARGEGEAAKQDAAALLGQLRAAEAMASAVEGEAACVRGQLAVAEEALGRARGEVERLKEEAAATAARLSATDLVRREAERERDDLELSNQRLRAALAEAEVGGSAAEQQLAAALAKAQQELAVERQRGEMLQAQAALAEAQGRETERMLTEQLRAVQEERNACLAAATRADALLSKLGQHALITRGVD